ncbi:hypothetical protein TNCV_218321 [Trichonephila clavipes]|nr:hypothetical protein TNCV_218321 [Trichonephila clavipes]
MTIHRPLMSESYAPTNRYATCHLRQHTIEPDYGGVWLDQSFHYPLTMNPPYYGQATDSHKGKKVGGYPKAFGDGPRNSEPWSSDVDDICRLNPSGQNDGLVTSVSHVGVRPLVPLKTHRVERLIRVKSEVGETWKLGEEGVSGAVLVT